MTNEALEAIRDKDILLKRAKRTRRQEDWDRARMARNRVGKDVENLRIDYLKDQQTVHKSNPKKFWATISNVVPGKKSSSGLIWLKHETSKVDLDQDKVAHYMNTFFTEVGPDLAKKHNENWVYYGDRVGDSIADFQTNADETQRYKHTKVFWY